MGEMDALIEQEIGDLDGAEIDSLVDIGDLAVQTMESTVENYVQDGLTQLQLRTNTNSIFKNKEAFQVVQEVVDSLGV